MRTYLASELSWPCTCLSFTFRYWSRNFLARSLLWASYLRHYPWCILLRTPRNISEINLSPMEIKLSESAWGEPGFQTWIFQSSSSIGFHVLLGFTCNGEAHWPQLLATVRTWILWFFFLNQYSRREKKPCYKLVFFKFLPWTTIIGMNWRSSGAMSERPLSSRLRLRLNAD